MPLIESPRARAAITGAILGGLIAVSLDIAGLIQITKIAGLSGILPGMILGGIIGMTRLRPALWLIAGALALLCAVVVYTPATRYLIAPLVRRDAMIPPKVDAIAALSGGATRDSAMSGESLDRLLSALQLARRTQASAVLVSREYVPGNSNAPSDRPDEMAFLAFAPPAIPVYTVDSVLSTRDEAVRMMRIARPHGWSSIALVTSPLHSRRACATFEAVGFKVTCVPSASRDLAIVNLTDPDDRLHAFRGWVYETAGTVKYKAKGWIK